jgi:colanic acid/amylovoran biosynthesis glycosyltransferase
LLYIQSFMPSFVKNEIMALKDAGVDASVIMLNSRDTHEINWGQIVGSLPNVVFAPDTNNIFKKIIFLGIDIIAHFKRLRTIHFDDLKRAMIYPSNRKNKGFRPLRHALRVARIADKLDADRIHTHFAWGNASVAADVACLLGLPFSLTVHANDIFALRKNEKSRLRQLFSQADKIITISRFNKDYLVREYDGDGSFSDKIEVIHCGIFVDSFSNSMKKYSQKDTFRIVTIPSGFVEKKGLTVLFKAIRILCETGMKIECIVIGDENRKGRRRHYEQEAIQLGISPAVEFLGILPQKELPGFYQTCNAFALPCVIDAKGKMDGIPVSLMEAMAVGLPVVSTRISGIPELIEHDKTGFLAEPGNPIDLTNQLKRLMYETDRVNIITKAAREKIESAFNIKINVQDFVRALSLN